MNRPGQYDPSRSFVWLDLDDTLWDMKGNSAICLRDLYESERLDRFFPTADSWLDTYHEINDVLWRQYATGAITRDHLRSERFARPLRMAGVDTKTADGMSTVLDKQYLSSLGKKTNLVSGAKRLLDYLHSIRGYRLGIVSNGFKEVQFDKLRSGGIAGYFDTVVLSDEAGVNKPDERLFDYAERKAGSRGTANIMIGDNFSTDIVGAIRAGWDAIWYNPSGIIPPDDEMPATSQDPACVRSLAEIERLL